MSIRRKMTVPAIALSVAAIVAVLATVCIAFSSFVDNSVYTEVDTYADVIQTKLDELRHESMVTAKAIAGDMQLREALSAGDRNALTTSVQQLQKELQTDYTVVADATGKTLASTDGGNNAALSPLSSVLAALGGEIKTVVGEGAFSKLSVDTGYPVYSDTGSLIGVVSAGYRLDTDQFVDGMSALTGCDISVFLGDTRIATTVTDEQNNRAIGLIADEEISRQVLGGEKFSGPLDVVGNKMYAVYLPIDSGEGEIVGMLFAGRYTSTKAHVIRNFILRGILVSAIALAVCIPIMVQRCRSVTAPIANMVQVAKSLAAGDLDVAVHVDSKDEISELADAFNTMIEHNRVQAAIIARIADGDLRDIVDVRSDQDMVGKALVMMVNRNNEIIMQILRAADEVATASEQLVNGSAALANNNSEQAATVDTLNNTVAVISKSTRKNARRSEEATALATEIRAQAEEGAQLMDQMTGAVTDISQAFSSVQYVLKTIDDISFQTNILSLNAAVEAARAGALGKGFGVVADEVRNLAAKCADAAKNSTTIIDRIQQTVDLGNGLSAKTEKSFHKIAEGINQSAALVADITQLTNKQAAELENLAANAAVFGDSLQTTSTLSEESSASAQELSAHASVLREIVSHFTLRETTSPNRAHPQEPATVHTMRQDKPFNTAERGMAFSKY